MFTTLLPPKHILCNFLITSVDFCMRTLVEYLFLTNLIFHSKMCQHHVAIGSVCEEWTKKGFLKRIGKGLHREEGEERGDLICGCMKLQMEWKRRELTTWNVSTGKNGEEK